MSTRNIWKTGYLNVSRINEGLIEKVIEINDITV